MTGPQLPVTGDELEDWYRQALAETMRPCREYHNGPAAPHPSVAQIEHHRARIRADDQPKAA